MNSLQHISAQTFGTVLVTLNPNYPPKPQLVQGKGVYEHPLYNSAAISSQAMLPQIQNTRGISYSGAWTKYGFHEDGFSSGIKVAVDHLGASLPFEFVDSTFSRGKRPHLGFRHQLALLLVLVLELVITCTTLPLRVLQLILSRGEAKVKTL